MISFIEGFFDSLSGFSLLLKPRIKRFVLIPVTINLFIFSIAGYWAYQTINSSLDRFLPSWLAWLEWLVLPLFIIMALLIIFYCFTIIANLIASPFNSLLSANVEAYLKGKKPIDINNDGFTKLVLRTTQSEIQKILYALKWFIPLGIITIIPGLNIISPFLWFVFAAWFFALEYNDYPLANQGQFFKEIKQYNKQNRMRALGFGSGIFLMTSIPVVNFLAMPVAIAGATKMVLKTQNTL